MFRNTQPLVSGTSRDALAVTRGLLELCHQQWGEDGFWTLLATLRTYETTPKTFVTSVPARLGKGRGAKGQGAKGQGAKEIGHNLARGQRKIGHNLVRKRHKIGHCLEREWPSEAHFYAWTTARSGHNFVGDRWKHGHKSASTSISTSAVWKHCSNYIL